MTDSIKNVIRLILLTVLAVFSAPPGVWAWGDDGHKIVARIATRKLTVTTRRRIVDLIRTAAIDDLGLIALVGATGAPEPSAANLKVAFEKMAIWPDHMPGGKGATGAWHFIDIGLFEGPATTADRCAQGCVTQMITILLDNIKAGKGITVTETSGMVRTFTPDQELRFVIHFLGDIHQPLHASTNADAGGNCVTTQGFMNVLPELHATWDTALVGLVEKTTLEKTAAAISAEFQSEIVVGGLTDPKQIAAESFALANDEIYPKTKPTPVPVIDHFVDIRPPDECPTKAPPEILALNIDGPGSFDNDVTKRVVRKQLYKAGVRLATILNSLFQ